MVQARAEAMPLGRLCEPIDIAHAVAWLAGPETDMMTGIGYVALKVMGTLLPDFSATNRSDALVDGVVRYQRAGRDRKRAEIIPSA